MREQLIQYVDLLFAGGHNCEDIKQEILQNTLDRYDDLIAEGKVPEAAYRLAISGIGDINELLGTSSQKLETSHSSIHDTKSTSPDNPVKKLLRAIAVGLYILCPLPLFVMSEFGMSTLGLCGLLIIVAVATILIILGSKKDSEEEQISDNEGQHGKSPLEKSISSLVWTIGTVAYFIISFATNAWHITWVFFPILGTLDKFVCMLTCKLDPASELYSEPYQNMHRKTVTSILNTTGLVLYFLLSFTTHMWYITWLVFPITSAVKGLVNAILDLKEAVENEA